MKLIVGASGLLGAALMRALAAAGEEVVGTALQRARPPLRKLDIRDAEATRDLIDELRPDTVYLVAALISADRCEEEPRRAWEINVEGAANAARSAGEHNAKLVFFSSDYIFDGSAGPYGEDDLPNPMNVYGWTKLAAEKFISACVPDVLVVRGSALYGWCQESHNLPMRVWRVLASGQRLAVGDQWVSPVHVDFVAKASVLLESSGASGVYHVAGAEHVQNFEFARLAARALDLNPDLIEAAPAERLQRKALRPHRGGLRNTKLLSFTRSVLAAPLPSLGEGMTCLRREWCAAMSVSPTAATESQP